MSVKTIWGAPGTGKTHVLKHKFKEHGGVGTLMVTFSRNTADDIKSELADEMGIDIKELAASINTIHGACFGLLGGKSHGDVITTKHIKDFNKLFGYNFRISGDSNDPDSSDGVYDAYTWLQNTETPIKNVDEYPHFRTLKRSPSEVAEQIKHYIEWKEQNGLIDFSDMLTNVLRKGLVPDVDLLLVDEFQDLTSLQYKIFLLWINNIPNVEIAGDPLQSIYGFMGGTPNHFNELSDNIEIIPKSYRLSEQVWKYAADVAENTGMETPDIKTSSHKGKIKHVSYREYANDIRGWEGTPTHTVYHLVRAKYQAPAICKVMADNGIIWAGLNGWTEYQTDVFNSITRVRNGNPLFKLHLRSLASVYPATMFNFWGSTDELLKHIDTLENTELTGISGGLITPQLHNKLTSDDPTLDMVNVGKTTQLKYRNALLKHVSQIPYGQIKTRVLTIHSSKGLDANRVFLHTGITTNTRKAMRSDPAAEARVFYVGITRAINELVIVKDKGANYPLPQVVS